MYWPLIYACHVSGKGKTQHWTQVGSHGAWCPGWWLQCVLWSSLHQTWGVCVCVFVILSSTILRTSVIHFTQIQCMFYLHTSLLFIIPPFQNQCFCILYVFYLITFLLSNSEDFTVNLATFTYTVDILCSVEVLLLWFVFGWWYMKEITRPIFHNSHNTTFIQP